MADRGKYVILTDAVLLLRSHIIYGPRLLNCWLPALTWVEALRLSNILDASFTIDVRKFNTAMSKSAIFGELMHRFDGLNTTGVFRITFKGQQYFYFTEQSRQIQYPYPLNSAWQERVLEAAANVLRIPSTRAQLSASATTTEEAEYKDEEQQKPSHKRQRSEDQQGDQPPQEGVLQQKQTIEAVSYWPDSPEASKVFIQQKTRSTSGRNKDRRQSSAAAISSESAKEALERRIKL